MRTNELHDELCELMTRFTLLIKDSWEEAFYRSLFRLVDDAIAAAVQEERERQLKRVREVSSC